MRISLFSKGIVKTIRLLFALNYAIGGLNYFVHLYKLPPATPQADAFYAALINTGYLFALVKAIEIGAGFLLIFNRAVPLALVILCPISVNILLFNTFLWPGGAPIGIFVMASNMYLLTAYARYYTPLLSLKTTSV